MNYYIIISIIIIVIIIITYLKKKVEPFTNTPHIFISSNVDYEKVHLKRLIDNIKNTNIPNNCVHIIIGGSDKETVEYIDEIEIVRVPYRSFEFTPFSYIIKNYNRCRFDYAFFTHDTVIFGKEFYNKLNFHLKNMIKNGYETMGIGKNELSMNIGIYKKEVILRNKDLINSITINNNDEISLFKLKHILVPIEDVILKTAKCYYNDISSEEIEKYIGKDIDDKSIKLRRKYYKHMDLIKLQTNTNGIYSIKSPINIY